MRLHGTAALLHVWLLQACSDEPDDVPPAPTFLDHPLEPLPALFSEMGLPSDRAVPYEPEWPLWSNGGDKARLVVLPAGTVIDTTEREHWSFPPGTLFFKTFSFGRDVETRVLQRTADGWDYGAYLWDDEGSEATKLDLEDATPVDVVAADGTALTHEVPSRFQCRQCHESTPGNVLGFDEVQLHAVLGDLDARGLFSVPPPADPDEVVGPDPVTRDVMGMITGNCTHCHNGSDGPSSAFDLRYPVLVENTVDQPTDSSATAPGIRVVPGDPDASILYLAFSGAPVPEVKDMPPVGVQRRDEASIDLVRRWILQLEETR